MHVLCGVVWRDYEAQVTGGNMEPLKARMDFEFKNFSADLVHEIELKVNLLPPNLTEIRIVEIAGLDIQTDGGTHVANTREIGTFKITGHKNKGKKNKRLKVELSN